MSDSKSDAAADPNYVPAGDYGPPRQRLVPKPNGLPGTNATDMQIGGDHYKNMPIQPGEYIYKNKLNWFEGNAVKYITRHRVKHGAEDIRKAIHYLQLLLEQEYDETY